MLEEGVLGPAVALAERVDGIDLPQVSLPASVSAQHWPLAWAGLDAVMSAGLAATAWLAVHRDRRAALAAVATATLLLVDAWFDVCTAPGGGPLLMALADMCVEVAEAVGCLVLAAGASCWPAARGASYSALGGAR